MFPLSFNFELWNVHPIIMYSSPIFCQRQRSSHFPIKIISFFWSKVPCEHHGFVHTSWTFLLLKYFITYEMLSVNYNENLLEKTINTCIVKIILFSQKMRVKSWTHYDWSKSLGVFMHIRLAWSWTCNNTISYKSINNWFQLYIVTVIRMWYLLNK